MVDIERQSTSALSRILTRSDQYLSSRLQPTCPPSKPARPIHVDLPEPPALLPALVAAGARQEVAQAMQAAYHQRACAFREQALDTISRACAKLTQIPSSYPHESDESIAAAFKQIYLKKLNTWISEGVALLKEKGPSVLHCRDDDRSATVKFSKTFNHQYVPLLEHFFEENPFPTHADKVFLAKKSNMTYRQIHVWFQNRRTRTKRILPKKPVTEGLTIPLQALICRMKEFAAPPTTLSDHPPRGKSTPVASSTELHDFLGGVPPPHAFPATYPPSCGYDPFPSVRTFGPPEWPRKTVPSVDQSRQSVLDVDELSEHFSRLNVRDDSRSRRKTTHDGSAATFAITVKPSPAPHPACVRTPVIVPTLPRITFQQLPAAPSSLHAFRSPSPDSAMTTLVPRLPERRKIAPLPKRKSSKSPSILAREISRDSMRYPSLSSSSRSSSFGSEVSNPGSRFTSTRTSSSTSTVATPETSPSPLSHPT